MNEALIPGRWYRLELQLGKVFQAEYRVEHGLTDEGWFDFPDGSSKQADTIIPYVESIIEIKKPDLSREIDLAEFLDDAEE